MRRPSRPRDRYRRGRASNGPGRGPANEVVAADHKVVSTGGTRDLFPASSLLLGREHRVREDH